MAARGFQQKPDSRRGLIENGGVIPEPIQEDIAAPAACKGVVLKEFHRLVTQNRAAGVSIRQIDADLYAELADAGIERGKETDGRTKQAWSRVISELRSELNIGPRNRQRAGVKDTRKPTTKSPTLGFIDRAKAKS